jgi:hypothetical protein
MREILLWRTGLSLVVAICLTGCGGAGSSDLDRHVVSGKVTLDGTPVENGTIQFTPAEKLDREIVSGTSIKNGAYALPAEGGLPAGTYRVAISASTPLPPTPTDPDAAMKAAENPVVAKELIPAKYNTKSELTVEVASKGSTVKDFELTSAK